MNGISDILVQGEQPGPKKPAASIIIASFNRAVLLQATVAQLLAQNFADFEIWVIDQSDAQDRQINAAYVRDNTDKRVNYLYLPAPGQSDARNQGLARAGGDIVLFVDDDVILLTGDFIGSHLRAYADKRIGGVTGRHVERRLGMNARHTACHVSWTGRTIFNLFGTEPVTIGSVKGSNMSFRMAAIRQIGGFDRRMKFLEETDFSTRIRKAGWNLMFEPAAELLHLSAPAGGVREKDQLREEAVRFKFTAYYVLKHRGWLGAIPFIATFSLIAGLRCVRFRSLKTIPILFGAMKAGFALARLGADEAIPAKQAMLF
jgi:GT2 family glycosyltransferase